MKIYAALNHIRMVLHQSEGSYTIMSEFLDAPIPKDGSSGIVTAMLFKSLSLNSTQAFETVHSTSNIFHNSVASRLLQKAFDHIRFQFFRSSKTSSVRSNTRPTGNISQTRRVLTRSLKRDNQPVPVVDLLYSPQLVLNNPRVG